MSTYAWGEYGQQGAERAREREERATAQAQHRQEVADLRARIPAWRDGVRQMDAKLVEARAAHAAAVDATARAHADLVAACFVRQRGECQYSALGEPIMDNNHPAVAHLNAAWLEAQQAESRAAGRIAKLEAERQYYTGLIAHAAGAA